MLDDKLLRQDPERPNFTCRREALIAGRGEGTMPGLTSNSLADLDRAYVPVVEAIVTSCNAQLAPSSMRVR